MELKRVLLKLSGEALAGDKKTGFDEATVKEVARQVKTAVDDGIEVGIVIGGGNFWRGRHEQCNRSDQGGSDRNAGNGHELYLRVGDLPERRHDDTDPDTI